MLETDDREPLAGDDLNDEPEDDEGISREPTDPLFDDEDLSPMQHMRLLMKMLHQAIADQLEISAVQPSVELEVAMANAKAELNWW